MKTKFRELHFRRRSTLHKIGEFCLSDHGRQPQFGQNSIFARSKAKIRNWKIIKCFFIMCVKPFSLTKNEGKLFLVRKSSGPLLAGLPLKTLHASIKSRFIEKLFITSSHFLWALARPPFLSLSTFCPSQHSFASFNVINIASCGSVTAL